jgi:anti-anti-sigma factor
MVRNEPAGLTTLIRPEGALTVVVLRGETDAFTVPILNDLLSAVVARRRGGVVIDVADLDFIDTTTVNAFTAWQHALDHRDRVVVDVDLGEQLTLRVFADDDRPAAVQVDTHIFSIHGCLLRCKGLEVERELGAPDFPAAAGGEAR